MAWVLANPSDELTANRSIRETRHPNRRTVSTRVTETQTAHLHQQQDDPLPATG